MITLTTPVQFGSETDAVALLSKATGDALNNRLQVTQVYGNIVSGKFTPSRALPGMFITINTQNGTVAQNGVLLMNGSSLLTLTPAQIASIQSAISGFQTAIETVLVALELFHGTVAASAVS